MHNGRRLFNRQPVVQPDKLSIGVEHNHYRCKFFFNRNAFLHHCIYATAFIIMLATVFASDEFKPYIYSRLDVFNSRHINMELFTFTCRIQ